MVVVVCHKMKWSEQRMQVFFFCSSPRCHDTIMKDVASCATPLPSPSLLPRAEPPELLGISSFLLLFLHLMHLFLFLLLMLSLPSFSCSSMYQTSADLFLKVFFFKRILLLFLREKKSAATVMVMPNISRWKSISSS